MNPPSLNGRYNLIFNKESGVGLDAIEFELGIRGSQDEAGGSISYRNILFYLQGVTGLPNDGGGWVDGHASVTLNEWSHVALTVTPSTVIVYLNRLSHRMFTGLGGNLNICSGPLRIGTRSPQILGVLPNDWFNGSIEEFTVYNRALSKTEIPTIYQAGSSGKRSTFYPIDITQNPTDPAVTVGSDATLMVRTTASQPVTYQWQHEGQDITGETNSVLTLSSVNKLAAGN